MNTLSDSGLGCIRTVIVYSLCFAIVATCGFAPLEYSVEYWTSLMKGAPVDIPAWTCWVACLLPPICMAGIISGALTLVASYAVDNPYYVAN